MTAERFYTLVEECLGGGWVPGELAVEEAQRTTHAVLQALARRMSRKQRLRLAAELPRRLAVELMCVDCPDDEPGDDTIARVADELQIDLDDAARRVAGVIAALRETVGRSSTLPARVEELGQRAD
jgi:uncharacterized protein (DUF2267 family)